jgi:hypothetical protein
MEMEARAFSFQNYCPRPGQEVGEKADEECVRNRPPQVREPVEVDSELHQLN